MPNILYHKPNAMPLENEVFFKATSGQINVDKVQGIVEAFVSGIGNKDSVGDIVVPGAFNGSLKRRKPRVVWGHDWNQPIGKVLEMYEVPSSDPRLPQKMKTAGVGALYAKVQFNLNTERGREAFANVAFYGPEQEWSIGYKTLMSDYDPVKQANILKEVELYEISPVLHGANQLTATISVKNSGDAQLGNDFGSFDDGPSLRVSPDSVRTVLFKSFNLPISIISMNNDQVLFKVGNVGIWTAPINANSGAVQVGTPTLVRNIDEQSGGLLSSIISQISSDKYDGMHDDAHDSIRICPECGGRVMNMGMMSEDDSMGEDDGPDDNDDMNENYDDNQPAYLKDPMTLLLMAYNEMLRLKGGSEVRKATLNLIQMVEKLVTETDMKTAKGFTIHAKCDYENVPDVIEVFDGLDVKTLTNNHGVDIVFDYKPSDDTLAVVADKFAGLNFDVYVFSSAGSAGK